MSENKLIEFKDVLGLEVPLTKLVKTISVGIGRVYEPTHIKRMAKAKAEEIKIIGSAIADNGNLPIKYDNGTVLIDGTDCTELANRAGQRLLYQEIRKQQNIEAVVGKAASILEKVTEVSDDAVDEDWVMNFFDSVKNVTSEKMQQIWAKILAGEIVKPGTFSLRTLNAVKNLSREEAMLFEKIAPYILYGANNICFLASDSKVLQKHDLKLVDILQLEECGLIISQTLSFAGDVCAKSYINFLHNRRMVLRLENVGDGKITVRMGAYPLTCIGREILKVIDVTPKESLIDEIAEVEAYNYKDVIKFTIHKVVESTGDSVQYCNEAEKVIFVKK